MKLTKLQRYTLYCIMLHELKTDPHLEYMCSVLHKIGVCNCLDGMDFIHDNLPEIYSKIELKNYCVWWWPVNKCSKTPRIKVLKQCIKETHP